MYTDLNMWDFATALAQETPSKTTDIMRKKAEIQKDRNDLLSAAATFVEIGDYPQAIDIYGSNGWLDKLIDLVRRLTKSNSRELAQCVPYFKKGPEVKYTIETLQKLGDISALLDFYVEHNQWEDGFDLAEKHPQYANQLYLPYANWLASQDRFVEAQLYYRKAGQLDAAVLVLEELAANAVTEKRFDDAAFYFWTLAKEVSDSLPKVQGKKESEITTVHLQMLEKIKKYQTFAQTYHAYNHVFRYVEEPFTSHLPESIFCMARYIYGHIGTRKGIKVPGISLALTLFALARLGKKLGGFQAAKFCFEKLLNMHIPQEWESEAELGLMKLRAQPSTDSEDLCRVCFACGSANPALNPKGDVCTACGEHFVHSFYSFEDLPLVKFKLPKGLSEQEARKLIQMEPLGDASVIRLPRSNQLGHTLESYGDQEITMDADALAQLDPHSVFEISHLSGTREYYHLGVSLSEAQLHVCYACQFFFLEEEWIYLTLSLQKCPFCRQSQ